MSLRVRFAPSPTGNLHIGGARTCLYCTLMARAANGKVILRIEDTDIERSSKESEESIIEDLKWLGLEFDEGPENPGEYGPYRQSERLDIYKKYAEELLEKNLAFYDFCTDEELEAMHEKAVAEGRDPHYEGPWKDFPLEEARKKVAAGEEAAIRFRAPMKSYTFKDHVRGEVTFPEKMVGDFVILRSNGLPTYNFCCVVDDHLMKISHVVRGDEHLNNTVRQLMISEALGFENPEFVHVSLLVGHDRQKLSKRHGATSVLKYRQEHWLPEALNNYLCLLGWSHPEEKDVFNVFELGELFDINRFSKSPALYDVEKLRYINGQHIKAMGEEELYRRAPEAINKDSVFHSQSEDWKKEFLLLFQEKIHLFTELDDLAVQVFEPIVRKSEALDEINSWETTPKIREYLKNQLEQEQREFVDADTFNAWMDHLKKEMKIKGKPLFMGMRGVLTGSDHGPDLSRLIPLTPVSVLRQRLDIK